MKGEKTTLNLNLTMADGTLFDIEEFTDPAVRRIKPKEVFNHEAFE